jgi:TATA-box binding protein (TBP) (component of TFIID and TFIIIB)
MFAISDDGVINNAYDAKSVVSIVFIVIILVIIFPSVHVIVWVTTLFPGFVYAYSMVSVVLLIFVLSPKSQSTVRISS